MNTAKNILYGVALALNGVAGYYGHTFNAVVFWFMLIVAIFAVVVDVVCETLN